MKILICIAFLLLALFLYRRATDIRIIDGKPHMSRVGCMFAGRGFATDRPIIFVPGIKGSVLQKDGKTLWFRTSDALHKTSPLIYKENDGVVASDLLARISVIPGIFEYKAYYGIARALACNKNGYVFVYDWREHLDTTSEKFGAFVERVRKETGKKPIVVAHSMGGLVAHGYVKQHPENIAKVVYVSVPFRPGIGYFDDVNEGAPIFRNTTILSKEAVFSHPATYYLLAHKGSNQYEGHDFFSATEWQENKWSVFKDSVPDIEKFQMLLDRAVKYHALLDAPRVLPLPALVVVSTCFPNNQRMTASGERPLVTGDGRVSYESAFPYDTFSSVTTKDFCAKHDAQMNSKELLQEIFSYILREGIPE